MEAHFINRPSSNTPNQSNKRHHSSWRSTGGWLALALLLLALAACSPGGATNTGSNPPQPTAPIHVPQGYHGMIIISFSTSTTYVQAKAAVQSAGLTLAVPCPNPGPIPADPTPRPTDQSTTYPDKHQLTAVGSPSLTTAMLNQVAAQPGVTSVDVQPPIECPLTSVGA